MMLSAGEFGRRPCLLVFGLLPIARGQDDR
jgi:hypothetical protein